MIQVNELSFECAFQMLVQELESGKEPPFDNPDELPIELINTAQSVLQPRGLNDISASEEHIKVLVKAIEQNKPSHTLDPIIVWWSGSYYRVIDGHHRLEAYQQVKKAGNIKLLNIPVQIFMGSLKDALLESTKLNSKNKLAMTEDDKFDRAWKLVCLGDYTIKDAADCCGISHPTVSRMRLKLKEYQCAHPLESREVMLGFTWKEMIDLDKVKKDFDEEYEIKQGKEWAQRLHKAFGTKLSSQPRIAAIALEHYSKNLVPSLINEWRFEIKEIYVEEDWGAELDF